MVAEAKKIEEGSRQQVKNSSRNLAAPLGAVLAIRLNRDFKTEISTEAPNGICAA